MYNVKVHNKRHRYLSLLAIMLMMGSAGASSLMPSGNNAFAAAKSSSKTVSGDSSFKHLRKAVPTSSRNGVMKVGTDFDGYIVFKKKIKPSQVTVFGGNKSSWEIDTAVKNSFLYHEHDGDKGHVGAYYKNIGYYYDAKTMKRQPVSFKIIVTNWDKPTMDVNHWAGASDLIRFRRDKVAINARGDGRTSFDIQTYVNGKKTNKRIPLSFWDIDYGQHIGLDGSTWSNTKKIYYKSPAKIKYEHNATFGGTHGKDVIRGGTNYGSVESNDPRGAFTANTMSGDIKVTYMRYSNHQHPAGRTQHSHAAKPGKSVTPTKKVKVGPFGNLFTIGSSINANVPGWNAKAKKFAGLKEKGRYAEGDKGAKNPDWKKKLEVKKPGGDFYYNIRNRVYWPAGAAMSKENIKGIGDYSFADSDIN